MYRSLFVFVFTFLIFSSFKIVAQSSYHIEYTYDLAGNRIIREIVIPREKIDSTLYHDLLAGHAVSIYPNPTDGLLIIEIKDIEPDFIGTVAIFDNTGKLVEEKRDIKSSMSFNMEKQAAGIYFLRFRSGKETKTWRIIKK